jgi:UDP-N-acetylglucosamine/UDP-N-acetylgalactosamine diphosphorylase
MADDLQNELKRYRQEHLLQFWESLNIPERSELQHQIRDLDLAMLDRLTSGSDHAPDWADLAARALPPPAIRLNDSSPAIQPAAAQAAGEEALRSGRIGMILAAGGQGTRLGFDHPKGLFSIGPLSRRTLFQMHVDRLLAMSKRYGVRLSLLIMTSPATDAETRDYFHRHQNLGMNPEDLIIFCQGSMPAVDEATGKILLSAKGEIALSPDGHGGLVAALHRHSLLRWSQQRGIDQFFYAQVDNPLVQVCDPMLIGYHLLARSEMTTQVVKKRFALEKVGNVVSIDGKIQIIEYSDLPAKFAEQTQEDGSLKLWAGNIAVHLFDIDFLQRVVQFADGLPFHRARKIVPFINASGELVKPEQPNAIKFERFVFDLLPMAERSIVVEGNAREVFAPVKNANGAPTDTPDATRAALMALHRDWLRQSGCQVEDSVAVEIHPSWALDATEVRSRMTKPISLVSDTYFA